MKTIQIVSISILCLELCFGGFLFLEGEMRFSNGKLHIFYEVPIKRRTDNLRLRLFRVQASTNGMNTQVIQGIQTQSSPQAHEQHEGIDELGNAYTDFLYRRVKENINIEMIIHFENQVTVYPNESTYTYPLDQMIQNNHKVYLQETLHTQRTPQIKALIKKFKETTDTQVKMVLGIFQWVQRHIECNEVLSHNDAASTLELRQGNTHGILNLLLSMLREAGIPCRVVQGFTHRKSMEFPVKASNTTPSSNADLKIEFPKSLRKWLEVYFPDRSWVPFDPFLFYFFLPTHFIKHYVSLDSHEYNTIITNKKHEPRVQFFIEGAEQNTLQVKKRESNSALQFISYPHEELHAWILEHFGAGPITEVITKKQEPKLEPLSLDFHTHQQHLDIKVSPDLFYGQGFSLDNDITIETIELPLFLFQTRNEKQIDVWLELRTTSKDLPQEPLTSKKVNIKRLKHTEKYQWVSFPFEARLKKGEYWMILKHNNQENILWRGIFGNVFANEYDSALFDKELKPVQYLYLDFNFRIRGVF